jgi:FlaA1/EpsC-like NDP-sugar epimerase
LRPGEKLTEELVDAATERLSPTRFEKIRVVAGLPVDPSLVADKFLGLEKAARRESAQEIYQILRDLNIGFVSNGELQANGEVGTVHESISAAKPS